MAQEAFSTGSLKDLIQLKFREERLVAPLSQNDSIRASGFARMCPREEVLAALHKITRIDQKGPDMRLTLAAGTGLHRALQEEILPDINSLLGVWKCAQCGEKHGNFYGDTYLDDLVTRPTKCAACSSYEHFHFVECFVENAEYHMTGHPDGFIKLEGRPGIGVLEAKTISQRNAWEVRKVPNYEHVIQVQIYMWFTGAPWACILYWDKGTYGLNGLFEHFIDRDEETIEAIKAGVQSIWDGIETGVLPPRICANDKCDRAMGCALKTQCFSVPE